MDGKEKQEFDVITAVRDLGVSTILFRNTLAKNLNLNLTESLCLTLLGMKGRLSPSELSRLTGLTTGSTTALIDRLETKGYVRRLANDRDRRGVIVEITDRHRQDSLKSVEGVQKAHKDLLAGYSAEELSVIADFLRRFTRNLADNSSDVRYVLGGPF